MQQIIRQACQTLMKQQSSVLYHLLAVYKTGDIPQYDQLLAVVVEADCN